MIAGDAVDWARSNGSFFSPSISLVRGASRRRKRVRVGESKGRNEVEKEGGRGGLWG